MPIISGLTSSSANPYGQFGTGKTVSTGEAMWKFISVVRSQVTPETPNTSGFTKVGNFNPSRLSMYYEDEYWVPPSGT
jgi:hypothetical protein